MPAKGKVLTPEQKMAMVASKQKRQMSKLDWSKADGYWDVELSKSQRNRKLKFITLREFYQHMKAGFSSRDLQKTGVSKHLLQFFSNFLQGKIDLDKATFVKHYVDEGMSLDEISEKHKITRDDMIFLRQLYDIKATGPTYQHRKRTEESLTDRQKEIIYGSLMGDGKKVSLTAVGFGQGSRQKDYLIWKFEELKNVASKNSLKEEKYKDPRSGYEGSTWRFYTHANSDIEKINAQFYSGAEKEISPGILKHLTPLSIAVWYMDDGSSDLRNSLTFSFCTDSYSFESCENIKKWFEDEYNIKTRIRQRGERKDGKPKYRVIIELESNKDFLDLIDPHILPQFRYKVEA